MSSFKRLGRELQKLRTSPPAPGINLVSADDLQKWLVDLQVMDDNPLYNNKTFRLQLTFSVRYPIEAPEVVFLKVNPTNTSSSDSIVREIPIHPHIYSNGIICLDLLSKVGWSPVQNVESISLSIQSMLTGNSKNERPQGDEEFVRTNTSTPRDILFVFHDQNV